MGTTTGFILCNRTGPRWAISASQEAWVELELERHAYRQKIHDIGPHGLSFELPASAPVPERDTLFQDVTVDVNGTRIQGHLAVSHVHETGEQTRICGARLIPADHDEQVKLDGLVERFASSGESVRVPAPA